MNKDNSYRSLLREFDKTKRELGEAETTIRRITGRDPDEVSKSSSRSRKFNRWQGPGTSSSTNNSYYGRKRTASYASSSWKPSRESESSYDEESDDEDESPRKKPTLSSKVVAKHREGKSRRAIIEEQNSNKHIKARNKRMFSNLIGVLTSFEHEENQRRGKELMRAEIEQKVEAATEEEREKIRKEKETLFVTRKEKQSQLRCLEKKIELAEMHEVHDKSYHYMENFIMTKTSPPIFYLPAIHNAESRKRLEECRSRIKAIREGRQVDFEAEISEIDGWYNKEEKPGDKENKSPKDEEESQETAESESESLVIEQEDPCDEEDDSNDTKNVGSISEQDFEPIYD